METLRVEPLATTEWLNEHIQDKIGNMLVELFQHVFSKTEAKFG